MKITSGTIARTVILLLALINQVLAASGHAILPISDAEINTAVTTILTIVTAVIGFWHNNSFTNSAIKADKLLTQIKAGADVKVDLPTVEPKENK